MSNKTLYLKIAIQKAGSQRALAKLIGAKQQNVWDWLNKGSKQVSPKFAMAIEEATGVSKHDLRPDIFGPGPNRPERQPPRPLPTARQEGAAT